MSEKDLIPWQFLSDEAVDQTANDSFGIHSVYAKLLLKITRTATTPFCVALYSNWGTGKTSVAKMLQSLALKGKDVAVIYLDVWKYSSDPLKRWILLETARQLAQQNIVSDYKYEDRTLQSHLEFEEQAEDESKVKTDFKILGWLIGILLVAVALLVLLALYGPEAWRSNGVIAGIIVVISGFTFMALLLGSVVVELFKAVSGMVFRRTVKHVTAKPAFSSEKFGEIFHDLVLTAAKKQNTRLLFIFDNLDRCPEAVAIEAISVIKTYLDEPNCVYLIPCDETALVKHLRKSYIGTASDSGHGYAQEFLNKFFQATLRLPAASEFDIEKYLDEQLKVAKMDDLPVEARDVLVLGYLGQTPRQIKRVINDLISFRALAAEAEQTGLIEPDTLTGDLPLLTKVSVISVHWPEFLNQLGTDPELWVETIDRINSGTKIEGMQQELRLFLAATRHVSPGSDVRPFIFLKRFDFEKDVKLSKTVEDLLRKGESTEYRKLLKDEGTQARQQVIIAKTAALGRQWLGAKRVTFLKNAAPLLVGAALQFPDQHQLRLLALGVLEHLASVLEADQLEEIVDVGELMRLDDRATSQEKKKVLWRLIGLFAPSFRATDRRQASWRSIIENSRQLDDSQKRAIAEFNIKRFSQPNQPGEMEVLTIMAMSKERPHEFAWGVDQELLSNIVRSIDFSETPLDEARIDILVAYQDEANNHARALFGAQLANYIEPPAKPVEGLDDAVEARALSALVAFPPSFYQPDQLVVLADHLVNQLRAANDGLKSRWTRPLIHLLDLLPSDARSSFEENIAQLISGPAVPEILPVFLNEIGQQSCTRLLSIPEIRNAVRTQASYLEKKFGKGEAESERLEFFRSFAPMDILELDLYDETRLWDLANLVQTFERAAGSQHADLVEVRNRLARFCREHLLDSLPDRQELYDEIQEGASKEPKLVDAAVADVLGRCALKLLRTDLEIYYPQFRTWRSHLAKETQTQLIRDAISELKDDEYWIQGLDLISTDVANDESLRGDQVLVRDLFDHSFAATEKQGIEALGAALNLLSFLNTKQLREYVDRTLDTLITYEVNRESLDRMEPFLRLLESPASRLTTDDIAKIVTFCRRLLGPANEPQEQSRALQFISTLKRVGLVQELRSELQQLSGSDQVEISDSARQLLGPSAETKDRTPEGT